MNAGRILALDVKRSISGLYLIGNEGVHLIAWKRQQTNLTRNMTMSGVNILRRSSSTNLHHKPRSSPPPHRVFPTHQDALWLKQSTPYQGTFCCFIYRTDTGGASAVGAKLFGIAALVIAVIALVPARATDTSLDLYMHATYIVVTPRHAILAFALLCGAFAGLYYFVGHALGNRLNDALTLAHFLLWLFSPIIFILEVLGLRRAYQAGRDPKQSWLLLADL